MSSEPEKLIDEKHRESMEKAAESERRVMELENKIMTAARAFLDNCVPPDIIAKSMPSMSFGDVMALNTHKAL